MGIGQVATRKDHLVVVGGGQAATQSIEVARQQGFDGMVTLVTEEATLPYQRPPLSKQYLAGKHDRDWLLYRSQHFYSKYNVRTLLGHRVVCLDRTQRTVELNGGEVLPYDKLVLATGARARPIAVPGANDKNVFYIRTLEDVERVRTRLCGARRLVIIGGGFIGLETAAVLSQLHYHVTLLAAQERLIPKLGASELADFFLELHRRHGVQIHLSALVTEIVELPRGGTRVVTADGDSYDCDLVLVGIGAIPNVELALTAGLDCDDGVIVDELARTSDPAIVAAGDCTNHPNPLLARRLRLETVHNAVEQGRTAGATIAGKDLPYIQTPWVWSDQYAFRLQSVGVPENQDCRVIRGDSTSGHFSIFYFENNVLLGANSINEPLIFGAVRRLLNEAIALTPEQAADPTFDLSLLPRQRARMEFDVPWPSKYDKQQHALSWGHE